MNNLKKYIESVYGKTVRRDKFDDFFETSHAAEDLKDFNVITNTKTKFHRLKFTADNTILAKCDYLLFINENVGYISDVDVHESIQDKKIGTKIREYAIKDLNVDVIYSYPTNDHIKYICRKQGFKPSDVDSSWFVKK